MNKTALALIIATFTTLSFMNMNMNKAPVNGIEAKFEEWKLKYGITYDTVEENNYRLAAFTETEKFIVENTNE